MTHRPLPKLALLAALAALAPACAYVKDRGLDLAQVADFSLGLSEGMDANLRVTKVAQVGVGSYRGIYWVGLKDGLVDVWEEERTELGFGPLYVHEVFRSRGCNLADIEHPLFGDPGFREHSFDLTHLTDRGWLDVGATLNLVFFGGDAAFKTAEAADFLTGVLGYDLLEDDVFVPAKDALVRRISGEDARVRAAAARALELRYGEDFDYALYTVPGQMPPQQIQAVRRWREYLEDAPE